MNESFEHDEELQRALEKVLPGEVAASLAEDEILIEIDAEKRDRRSEDAVMATFFGFCVLAIAFITVLPAVYYWVTTANQTETQPVARWAFLLGFMAAVHVVYAIYAMQVVDFSALQSMAIVLLVFTCIYGFIGMSLWLGDGNGPVARFLQIPVVLKARATIWCGIMFGITSLACYLFGREALLWRRRASTRGISESFT